MKIRHDFVTNSSSSSFIFSFNDPQEIIKKATEELKYYPEALGHFVTDFMNATPLTEEQVDEILHDEAESAAYSQLSFAEYVPGRTDEELKAALRKSSDWGWWSSSKPTFEKYLLDTHPECKDRRYNLFELPEWKNEMARMERIFFEMYKESITGKQAVILEYEDHDDIGATLEGSLGAISDESFNHH